MTQLFKIPCSRSVGKSTDHCPHNEDGKPAGYPLFCCAWPGCPKGVVAAEWIIQYGAHGDPLNRARFTREQYVDEDGISTYSWKKIE